MLRAEAADLRGQATSKAAAARALRREIDPLESLLHRPDAGITPEVWKGSSAEQAYDSLRDAKSRLAAALDALETHIAALEREAEQLTDSADELERQADAARATVPF